MSVRFIVSLLGVCYLAIIAFIMNEILGPVYDCDMMNLTLYDTSSKYQMCVEEFERKELIKQYIRESRDGSYT